MDSGYSLLEAKMDAGFAADSKLDCEDGFRARERIERKLDRLLDQRRPRRIRKPRR